MPTQTTGFFELAALLIPVLLLSGYVTQRMRPTPAWQAVTERQKAGHYGKSFLVVAVFGIFPAEAEVLALSATMQGGSVPAVQTWIVASAVAFGTWALVFAIVWPWIASIWMLSRVTRACLATLAVAFLIPTVMVLQAGVDAQQIWDDVNRVNAKFQFDPLDDNLTAMFELQERQLVHELDGTHGKARREILAQIDGLLDAQQRLLLDKAKHARDP